MAGIIPSSSHFGPACVSLTTLQPDTLPPQAKLIFFHGFSDHIDRYYDFFPHLASRGIAVYGLDQRGWGKSALDKKEWGLSGPTSQVLSDMVAFIRPQLPSSPSDPPVFVMGHSMGGGQTLILACEDKYADVVKQVRGWLCESPYVGLSADMKIHPFTIFAGRLAARVLPHRKMVNGVPPERLSRDVEVQKSIVEDPLLHNTGTLEGLSGMLDRSVMLTTGLKRVKGDRVRSLWVGHGTEDKGTDHDASKKWVEECAAEVADRTFRSYEGAYHQLHADFGREEFYEDVARWILERSGGERDEARKVGVENRAAEAKL